MVGIVSGKQIAAQYEQDSQFITWWAKMFLKELNKQFNSFGVVWGAIYGGQPPKREVDYFIERHGRIN